MATLLDWVHKWILGSGGLNLIFMLAVVACVYWLWDSRPKKSSDLE